MPGRSVVSLVLVALCAVAPAGAACGSDDNSAITGRLVAPSDVPVRCGGQEHLSAEGSSAQKTAVDVFVAAYQSLCRGHNVAYNPTGSGSGVKQFTAGLVDLAGTDSPLSREAGEVDAAARRCGGAPAWHLPLVFAPIAVAYRLDGFVGRDRLTLDAGVAADIFDGTVTRWNDPAIAALNPGATLPDLAVQVVHRSDESGTSENFQHYLTAASPDSWPGGAGKRFTGRVGEGRDKSAGVAHATAATDGAVTYVELSFALDAGLDVARIDNGAGPVEPSPRSVGRAIDAATVVGDGHDLVLDVDSVHGTTVPGAYPLVLVSYQVVCSRGYGADTATAVKAFLTVAVTAGQRGLADAGYAPLPPGLRQQLLDAIDAIA